MGDSPASSSFLYFGFGSNMNTQRIRKNSPSAEFVAIAKLPDYALKFGGYSHGWKGATAYICEEQGQHVWAVVWKIMNEHSEALDRQEGSRYRRIEVSVTSSSGEVFICRAYALANNQTDAALPSPHYLNTVITGAGEHCLPREYLDGLSQLQHNGYGGEVNIP